MTGSTLGASYVRKVKARIAALHTLLNEAAYSDVVRECQEAYELLTKAILRFVGIDPPRIHDVSATLREHESRLPQSIRTNLKRICSASLQLRKDREFAFDGADDFIPDENYSVDDAKKWISEVESLFDEVNRTFK